MAFAMPRVIRPEAGEDQRSSTMQKLLRTVKGEEPEGFFDCCGSSRPEAGEDQRSSTKIVVPVDLWKRRTLMSSS
jgi:hypothetical protein